MSGTYHITTFGCQMNKSDSERLTTILSSMGLTRAMDENQADVILLNTCSVRQMAEDRIYGHVHNLRQLKEQNPKLIVGVTGCMAGRDRDGAIRKRLKEVDLFFPTEEMVFLPQKIAELNPDLINDTTKASQEFTHYLSIRPTYPTHFQAYVSISTGCNKFCTYCVVPFSRGLQKDRPVRDVMNEIRERAESGCLEITLLGQTVNWYRPADPEIFALANPYRDEVGNKFAALLWEINQIAGIQRIHFTAPHPNYMSDALIDAMTLPKQVNFLHLPVQCGNDEILKRMNRPYTRERYLDIIRRVYARTPNLALATDIIVGFCGETEAQFQDTVSLYQECQFDISYTAMYSVRSGTLAARRYGDDVPYQEKKRRWRELQTIMEEIVLKKNQRFVGSTIPILVDSYEKGICSGNSLEMKRVQFRGNEASKGTIVQVHIERAGEWMLFGSVQ